MCDTIVINKRLTENRENILAKNSDRPLGECQPLALFAKGTRREKPVYFKDGDEVYFEGTGLGTEGSRYAVLGSRPYWLYGFEMGANEKGLFIGNEAEGSRISHETEEGILGMDMLRFALEACATAQEAIGLIGKLLARYGQNANASPLFDRRYENTYILADKKETWVMETAGRHFAAKKIPYMETVSNCYTIEQHYDLASPGMEDLIRERRFLHPDEPVNFAKAFTLPAPRQRMSVPRRNRMAKLLLEMLTVSLSDEDMEKLEQIRGGDKELLSFLQKQSCRVRMEDLDYIFTDHFEGEVNEERFSARGGDNCSVCMHANTWDESQTAAGMWMTEEKDLGMKFYWAPASPCTSVYLPVWWVSTGEGGSKGPEIPACMSLGEGTYDDASLWWRMERLVSLLSVDEEVYLDEVAEELEEISESIRMEVPEAEKKALALIKGNDFAGAQKLLDEVTEKYAQLLFHTAAVLSDGISEDIAASGGLWGPRQEFLKDFSRRTKMPL